MGDRSVSYLTPGIGGLLAPDLSPSRWGRRVVWPSHASQPYTRAAGRALARDWPLGRHGSSAGTFQDLLIATSDWPLVSSPDWRLAICGGPPGVSPGPCTALFLAGAA